MEKFTVEAGRAIRLDGKPFVNIARADGVPPTDADAITHLIAYLLNKHPEVLVDFGPDGYFVVDPNSK